MREESLKYGKTETLQKRSNSTLIVFKYLRVDLKLHLFISRGIQEKHTIELITDENSI